ncbi:LppU/SCO3897 family protein [Streptomyces sp. NPDC002845]
MTTPPPQGQNPFAPQPAQPGVPQQQPYPPQQDTTFQGAPVPPPAPKKRFSKKLLRLGAVIVVAIAIAGGKWYLNQTDAETASVGSCMHNEGTMSEPDLKTVDCSSGDSEYEVVEKFDDTSDRSKCETVADAEIAYYQIGDNHDVVLCLKEV